MLRCNCKQLQFRMVDRRAKAREAWHVSAPGVESKAHWDCSRDSRLLWETQLRISSSEIASKLTWVSGVDGDIAGSYSSAPSGAAWELGNFWILSRSIRHEIGSALLIHTLEPVLSGGVTVERECKRRGVTCSLLCGAARRGEFPALAYDQPNRMRPAIGIQPPCH